MAHIMDPHGVGMFLLYFATMFAMLWVFSFAYQWVTPYDEDVAIFNGELPPAIAFSGALLGFTMPLVTSSLYNGGGTARALVAFIAWAALAGFVQIVVFKLLFWFWRNKLDNTAKALVFAAASVCVGIVNAAAMIP